jgi:ketosteroid isomerase-like protein
MQEQMTVPTPTHGVDEPSREPTVRKNVQEELMRLRVDLNRIAHEIRMKSKNASAEIQDTRQVLERELRRFGTEVDQAIDRTREDLVEAGKDLRMRFTKLAHQIAFPAS